MSTAVEDISDSEVSAVFQSSAGLQSVINTAMLQANAVSSLNPSFSFLVQPFNLLPAMPPLLG